MSPAAPTPDIVIVSAHAAEQYQQRVKPGLEPDAARAELQRLRAVGEITTTAPNWLNAARPAPYYLLLGDCVVLPLAPHGEEWVATTCVTETTLTRTRRGAKYARNASLGSRKRGAEPDSEPMLLVASTSTGESSTLLGLVVLALAVAGAAVLLARLQRLMGWQRRRRLIAPLIATVRARCRRPRLRGARPLAPPDSPLESALMAPVGAPERSVAGAGAGWSGRGDRDGAAPVLAERGAGGRPPALGGARLSPETLEPLGQRVDNSRRLAVADARLSEVLSALDRDRWFVERNVVFAAHPIPWLIVGETGVFALWGAPGSLQWRDLPFYSQMAANVRAALPGYSGQVHAGVCRVFEPGVEPRWWCRSGEPAGAWVMGPDWVIGWLEHFGVGNGIGAVDIQRLRELAGPRWQRPVSDVPASAHIPNIA